VVTVPLTKSTSKFQNANPNPHNKVILEFPQGRKHSN